MTDNSNAEYVALQPIDHNGVRAYNPGDRVPVDNVKTHGYEVGVQVALAGTTDATAITPPADPGQDASENADGERAKTHPAATEGTPPPAPPKPAKASGSK